jgi:hypothetical protein
MSSAIDNSLTGAVDKFEIIWTNPKSAFWLTGLIETVADTNWNVTARERPRSSLVPVHKLGSNLLSTSCVFPWIKEVLLEIMGKSLVIRNSLHCYDPPLLTPPINIGRYLELRVC